MKRLMVFLFLSAISGSLLLSGCAAQGAVQADYLEFTPDEKIILAGADERIEKYRKGTAHLSFVTADRKPISNVKVKIEQIEHEFLFGANSDYGIWGEIADKKLGIPRDDAELTEEQLDDYLEKFNAFANYINIPSSWGYYEPKKDEFNHELFEKIFNWVDEQGALRIHSGFRIWNYYTPRWVTNNCDVLSVELEKCAKDFSSHFKGRYKYHTVVNEPANPFRKIFLDDQMTECIRKTGIAEWNKKWFTLAREEEPESLLVINEVSILPEHGFPELLKNLKDNNGKPLYDIIGIQSHMHNKLWSLENVWKACEGYSTFGVPVHFTEVTILSGAPVSGGKYGETTTTEGEREQAEYAVNFYTILFSHPSVEAILWWNLSDYKSWKNAPAGLLRKDMSPKPSYTALMDLIYNKWWTKTETKTSKQGQAEFKGFYGDYNITITTDSGEIKTFKIQLSKKGKQEFQLVL